MFLLDLLNATQNLFHSLKFSFYKMAVVRRRRKLRDGSDRKSSFSKAVHHSAVGVGLLGHLLGPGHLQNLPEEMKRQVQRQRGLIGPLRLLPPILFLLQLQHSPVHQ